MVRASRGSDLFSPPLVPWRATVDRQARDVNEGEAGRGEHRLGQAGDAADHIQADADRAAELAKLGDELRDLARRIGQFAVDQHDAIGVDRGHPMHLLGNVDPDADPHGAPPRLKVRHPARAVVALHSDGSQSLISGRGGVAVPGDLPPEPSWAASMKTIPTPPPHHDPGMPGSWCQALPKQHLDGRAA